MKKKLRFPYGNCNFYDIITDNYFFIDRTDRIHMFEDIGKTILLLRPRRFGKSLLISTLENYYDLAKADQFEKLFGHLAIGQNPTPNHNQYFVLKLDFSMIDPQGDVKEIKQSLYSHINERINFFAIHYQKQLRREIKITQTDGLASFQSLLNAIHSTSHNLYLLIDEYDNFANEVMVSQQLGQPRYERLLGGEGIFKTLFKVFKGALAGMGLERVFMTGVSPVVMSDLTSGQFLSHNIYFKPEFNDLCGFLEEEVFEMLQQVTANCGMNEAQTSEAMEMMRTYYDGYCFVTPPDTGERIYNPTLVFYFLQALQDYCRYPVEMLDENLNIDRHKLEYAAFLPSGDQAILKAVAEDSHEPLSVSRISNRFGVRKMLEGSYDENFVASLLYYFGMLTFSGEKLADEFILRVPNLTVEGLYFERLQKILLPELNKNEALRVAKIFYTTGNLRPLCDHISRRLAILDNRDYLQANELMVKAIFLSVLFNNLYYMIDSEMELKRGYADLVMIVRPDRRQSIWLDHLIEFKYVKLGEADLSGAELQKLSDEQVRKLDAVDKKVDEAKEQLARYRKLLTEKYGDLLRLHTHVVVAVGFERLLWEEIRGA
ncbi:AAA family ATPase [Anaerolineales bacterium HSG24]|nr:AAA family ATPase [Anaerolineales bacterium HSG24]